MTQIQTTEFDRVFKKLNQAQKTAVEAVDGPVMVIAGPGTGKTQVLAARIANILQTTDTEPHAILALTFTESAAENMRERVVKLIGRTGYYVNISTFHAFCQSVIETHPEYFPIDRGSKPVGDLERYTLFENCIKELPLEALKPLNRPLFYIKDVIKAVSDLKREGVSPVAFDELVIKNQQQFEADGHEHSKSELDQQQKNVAKQQELALIFHRYEELLRESLRYDFDDMIVLVAAAFEHEESLLLQYQESLHYFLVDEYQDTNSAQNKVVGLLASYWGEQANLFVVGDPHQSIYRFQGASIENVVAFTRTYQNALVVTLDQGYRCVQPIYDSAHKLIANNTLTSEGGFGHDSLASDALSLALNKKLTSMASGRQLAEDMGLKIMTAPTEALEVAGIAREIQSLQSSGVLLKDIAILYRHNKDAEMISEVLGALGISSVIDAGSNALDSEEVRQLLKLFSLILAVRSSQLDEQLFEVLCYEWLELDRLLVLKLVREASTAHKKMSELVYESDKDEYAQLRGFLDKLNAWSTLDPALTLPEWFERVIHESGFVSWLIKQPQKAKLVAELNALFDECKKLTRANHGLKVEGFLKAIAVMREHDISIQVQYAEGSLDAVRLSTAHRAKGQEWEYVFLAHVIDGKWGNNRKRTLIPLPDAVLLTTDLTKKERNEDERRLFYVALTRAKKQVVVSYPQSTNTSARVKPAIKSMFISELGVGEQQEQLIFTDEGDVLKATELLLGNPTQKSKDSAQLTATAEERAFFENIVRDFKLSVTALNAYLRDPREFVLNYLLRIPQATPEHMAFGTAVHRALEAMYKEKLQTQALAPLPKVLAVYSNALKSELIGSLDLERRLQYGESILTSYHGAAKEADVLHVERYFGSGSSAAVLDVPSGFIQLSGRIDRIDWVDKEAKHALVVDYKTGKLKSVNDILGKTVAAGLSEREQALPEEIRGSYKRQLLFYKLLTDLDRSFKPTVTQGVFEFVEPDKKTGTITRRMFDLPVHEVELLKALIAEVVEEIRSLTFLDTFYRQ